MRHAWSERLVGWVAPGVIATLVIAGMTLSVWAFTGAGARPESGAVAVQGSDTSRFAEFRQGLPEGTRTMDAQALALVREWNAGRSHAWSTGDTARLDELYSAGSGVGRADVDAMDAWVGGGWKVHGLDPQVLAVTTVSRQGGTWVVDVRERLGSPLAVRGEQRVRLPAGAGRERRVTFVARRKQWLVMAVEELSEPVESS